MTHNWVALMICASHTNYEPTHFLKAGQLLTVAKHNVAVSITTQEVAIDHSAVADHHTHPLVQVAGQQGSRLRRIHSEYNQMVRFN